MDDVKKVNKKDEKREFSAFFNDCKGEFRKIVWPSRSELIKKTVTVLIACAIVGAIILAFDYGFGLGLEQFTNFFS
jgi:preprotein translocase subunit SecE